MERISIPRMKDLMWQYLGYEASFEWMDLSTQLNR